VNRQKYICKYVCNKKLTDREDSARQRSLRHSRSFKVTDVSTKRKPVCDFLLVNHTNLHPISHSSGQIIALDKEVTMTIHRVSKKTSTHIIGYKLRNSCPILIIFDIKIPHII